MDKGIAIILLRAGSKLVMEGTGEPAAGTGENMMVNHDVPEGRL
jgi:hypothetical protein